MRGAVGSQLHFFSFLLLLSIIAAGVAGALYLQFGQGLDVREQGSSLFATRVESCVREGLFTFTACGLSVSRLDGDTWFGRVCEGDCFAQGNILDSFGQNPEICRLSGAGKNAQYPRCSERTFFVGTQQYMIVMGTNYPGGKHA